VPAEENAPGSSLPTERQAARMRVPEPRHRAARVNMRSKPQDLNTVAMPWVSFEEDRVAILAGQAVRQGNRFVVHSREYVLEGGGRLMPVAGPGLVQLGRGAYRALGLYNTLGLTEEAERQLDLELIVESEREAALRVWRALDAWRQGQG
jgi:hypothetical protein